MFDLSPKVDPSKNTVDKHGNIRGDFLFSYWIFAWFVLYSFLDKSTPFGKRVAFYCSPMVALWFGFLYDFFLWIRMIFLRSDFVMLIKYAIMLLLIKIMPLYVLRRTPIHWIQDTLCLVFVFLLYFIYLRINETTVTSVYEKTERAILSGENKTPLFRLTSNLLTVLGLGQ